MKKKTYRVQFEQVNQVWVEVQAKDPGEACEKAYRKWRRDEAHTRIAYVAEKP